MEGCRFLSENGDFKLENPELSGYLYFPLANEKGTMSSITPDLGGDMKISQNAFALAPVSSENLHNDKSSRNIWLKINGTTLWSVTGRSAQQQAELFTAQKDQTTLEADFMYQKLTRVSRESGIQAQVESIVPNVDKWLEYHRITVTNCSQNSMKIQPITAVPLYGRSADNIRDHRHVTSLLHRIHVTRNGVVVTPTMTFDERGHQENKLSYGVFAGNAGDDPIGFYPDTEDYIGEGGSYENPRSLSEPARLWQAGESLEGYEACGTAVLEERELQPGESRTILLTIMIASSDTDLQKEAQVYLNGETFEQLKNETIQYWQKKVNIRYFSGEKAFDCWMRWVSFQPILRRIYGCSFLPHHDYGKGGRGWRDLWQDCLALLIMDPSGVRQMMIDNFGGVRLDGTNATIIGSGQGEFKADRNGIARVWMDHGMWPFLTLHDYLELTGDDEILFEMAPYFKDQQICRGEKKDEQFASFEETRQYTAEKKQYFGSVLEHVLVENLTAVYDVGEHNEIRLRGADWNDALDMAPERGESIAFTAMYAENLDKIADILERRAKTGQIEMEILEELLPLIDTKEEVFADRDLKKAVLAEYCNKLKHFNSGRRVTVSALETAQSLRTKAAWIKENIRSQEWLEMGEYGFFNGYYDNNGCRLEHLTQEKTDMMLTSQVFTIMSRTASDPQIAKIIKTADRWLYEKKAGGYRLNTDFHEVKYDMGRMFGFAYGQKENGAVFSHMAVMYANALYRRGYAKEGFHVIDTLQRHCMDFETSRIYPGIPEYIDVRGRGMYHYLTGAASWLLLTVLTQMYGVRGREGNLSFAPSLLKEQFDERGEAAVDFVFCQRELRIRYQNINAKEVGEYRVARLSLDGREYEMPDHRAEIARQDILQLQEDRAHEIVVILE